MSSTAASRRQGDYWSGYRFTPALLATTADAVWVVESHLPLIARVDPVTGDVTGPRRVGPGDPAGRGAHDLLAAGDLIWIRWNDGISAYRPASDDERWVDLSAAGLAVGDAGAWALTGDGRLARLDPGGDGFEPIGEPEVRRHSIAVGHGAVWTLTWTHVPGGSTLSRIDPDSGRVEGHLPVQGSPRQLVMDRDAVYVRVWRRDAAENVEELLLGVEPESVKAAGEMSISPAGSGGAVRDGIVWASDVDPYSHAERGAPSTLRRIDARTGHLLGATEVPGWPSAVVPGPAGVWGCLERRTDSSAVIEVNEDGTSTRTVELSDLEIADYLPDHRGR